MKKFKQFIGMTASILIMEGIGILSAVLAGDIAGKYDSLIKVPLSLPAFVFGPVWTLLYAMLGIIGYFLITANQTGEVQKARVLFVLQILLNFSWCLVFFGNNMFYGAGIIILVMDVLGVYLLMTLKKINQPMAWTLLPYLLWIVFATYLTFGTAVVNG